MKTKEQIEEMASDYSTRFITEDQFQKQDRIEAYSHGYTQAQQDLISEADDYNVKSFEEGYLILDKALDEAVNNRHYAIDWDEEWDWIKEASLKLWQAAIATQETFDPSISAERYHIWCKHHQKVSEIDSRKIAELEAFKKEALEVIGFYGRKENWTIDGHEFSVESQSCKEWDEYLNTLRIEDYGDEMIGGKRARTFLAKYGKEKGEIK